MKQQTNLEPFKNYKAININGKTYPLKLLLVLAEVQRTLQIEPELKTLVENDIEELKKTLPKEIKDNIDNFIKDTNVSEVEAFLTYNTLYNLDAKRMTVANKFNLVPEELIDLFDLAANVEILTVNSPDVKNLKVLIPPQEEEELNGNINPLSLLKTIEVY